MEMGGPNLEGGRDNIGTGGTNTGRRSRGRGIGEATNGQLWGGRKEEIRWSDAPHNTYACFE